jgi:hypothetical protein
VSTIGKHERSPGFAAAVALSALGSLVAGALIDVPDAIQGFPWGSEYVFRLGVAYLSFRLLYRMVTATWLASRSKTLQGMQSEREAEILAHYEAAADSLEDLIGRIEDTAKIEAADDDG